MTLTRIIIHFGSEMSFIGRPNSGSRVSRTKEEYTFQKKTFGEEEEEEEEEKEEDEKGKDEKESQKEAEIGEREREKEMEGLLESC